MAQCDEISLLLGAFEDGELEPHEMREVAVHLAACKGCELVYSQITRLGMMLRDAAPVADLNDFTEAVVARVARMRPSSADSVIRRLAAFGDRTRTSVRFAGAMAIAAAVTVLIALPVARRFDPRAIIPWDGMMRAVGYQPAPLPVADNAGAAAAQVAEAQASTVDAGGEVTPASAGDDSSAVISKLETQDPNVAVWSEPSDDTTVIWLPDQH